MAGISRIKKGQVITARFLNRVVDDVNRLNQFVKPRDQRGVAPPENEAPDDNETTETISSEVWVELSRKTDTVRITDPDDAETYVDVQRISHITFGRPFGRGGVTLVFNNPDIE